MRVLPGSIGTSTLRSFILATLVVSRAAPTGTDKIPMDVHGMTCMLMRLKRLKWQGK
jgi:hypothetical protein